MISIKSQIELLSVISQYSTKTIDRIFVVFDIDHLIKSPFEKYSTDDKLNILLKIMKRPPEKGPFTSDFNLDLLQYMVDLYYRNEDNGSNKGFATERAVDYIDYDYRFSFEHKSLTYSLARDGYVMKGQTIRKQLPQEIEEAKSETELFLLLVKFNFEVPKGHLEQAISNHSQGNWAGANSQFRTFLESLLIGICNKIVPANKVESAQSAINILSKSIKPPFLREDLNEVENNNCKKPFIEGLWKRLHPEGSHPGLSDEEDSTFRYHIIIVVAHYLLRRYGART
jgi:hypothetical protein